MKNIKLMALLILTVCYACSKKQLSQANTDTLSIDGLVIPLSNCIEGTARMITNREERKQLCACVAKKLLSQPEVRNNYLERIKKGDMATLMMELSEESYFDDMGIPNCLDNTQMEWNDNLRSIMREMLLLDYHDPDFTRTNNLEQFCNCLIGEYAKYSASEVMDQSFQETELGLKLENKCMKRSKIK